MRKLVSIVIFISLFYHLCAREDESRGVNGGMNCAVCTVVSGIIQQRAYLEGISLFDAAKKFCKELPSKYGLVCFETVERLEPLLLDKRFLTLFTPDVFCYSLDSCHIDPGENFCHLFPKPYASFHKSQKHLRYIIKTHNVHDIFNNIYSKSELLFDYKRNQLMDKVTNKLNEINFCEMPIFKTICDVFLGTFGRLTPAIDFDDDGYSIISFSRGSDWRGKDCSDIDSQIYPGAQTHNFDVHVDANCNGIWGVDNESGRPWEEILCSETNSKGLVYLGDSIGAHFHFPEVWMNPTLHDSSSISTIAETLMDELDWPELGFATGYKNSSYPLLINGVTDSIYLRLRANNLCSHRDFHNGAKNAAMSWNGPDEAKAISRKPSDKPLLVIYAMLGNDVCNRFRDTISNMTKPDQFKKLVLETLSILDEKLPLNSDVVLMSLLDASFIYPTMAERIHPLGSVLKNIRYKDLYSWFSCMQIGPCEGWMTPNTTLQKITSQKAAELSMVLRDIAKNYNFISFKITYLDNPFNEAINAWVENGGHIYDLIDPIDSTHPNQKAQPLFAEALWKSLKVIGLIGPENPNNNRILQMFGDQGGH